MPTATPHTPDTRTAAAARSIAAELPAGEIKIAGISAPLPPMVAEMLREMLASLAGGKSVGLVIHDREMTPDEAAEVLNVPRNYVLKLMDDATLPFRTVGSRSLIPSDAVLACAQKMLADAEAAMTELVRLSEEMGLYDMDPRMPSGAE